MLTREGEGQRRTEKSAGAGALRGIPDCSLSAPRGEARTLPHLKAARYSASPMGGSRPPVKAMLTLKPTPGPVPTCMEERNSCHDLGGPLGCAPRPPPTPDTLAFRTGRFQRQEPCSPHPCRVWGPHAPPEGGATPMKGRRDRCELAVCPDFPSRTRPGGGRAHLLGRDSTLQGFAAESRDLR